MPSPQPQQPDLVHSWAFRTLMIVAFALPLVISILIGILICGGYGLLWILVAFPELAPTDTVYPDGFSDSSFRTLQRGMTRQQVQSIAGPPLSKYQPRNDAPPGEPPSFAETWVYSKSPRGGDYWRRWVEFQDGKVSKIISDFWID